jgi:phosphoribosyl 1,2-cyclic phosphodiesterase
MTTVSFHGVRGSCPCSDPRMRRYGGATACVAVRPDGGRPPIVLDLGTGSRLLGEEMLERYYPDQRINEATPPGAPPAAPGVPRLEMAAFVTHLHFDHVQGLPFFGPALRSGTRLTVHAPQQEELSLEAAFSAFIRRPYFPVGLDELGADITWRAMADGERADVGGCSVVCRAVPHSGPTLGYRVECDGSSVAYVSDHQQPHEAGRPSGGVAEAVLTLAAGADLLVHDAQYTTDEFVMKAHWGHSTVAYAVEVARAARVRRVALFHHDPTHDDETLDELALQAAELSGGDVEVLMAREGLEVPLT